MNFSSFLEDKMTLKQQTPGEPETKKPFGKNKKTKNYARLHLRVDTSTKP